MEPPSPYTISILNDSERPIPETGLCRVAQIALADRQLPAGELSVRLTTSATIRNLNREYRQIDAETDVLTFPAVDLPIHGPDRPLGDIAISVDRADTQARMREIALDDELAYLLIHGILHLSGLDDETDPERETMLSEMARIGALIGLAPVADWHTLEEVAPRR